ncbi:MAG TPA: proprotein convertase P-domain-containing protein, partial [Tepidisphaeraceae bacterium]
MVRVRDAGRVSHRLNLIRDMFGAGALLARLKGRRRSRAQTAHSLSMLMDALENRTLLSTLPAPITTDNTSIVGLNTAGTTNYSSPSVAYNPLNPLEVVEASVEDVPSATGTQKVFIQLSYSKDGGATWTGLGVDGNVVDPVASTPTDIVPYAQATDPTVGFDRLGNFYLSYSENTANTQGEIVIDKYSFTGSTPASVYADQKVYSWNAISAAPGAALHPDMAVNDNVPTYTSDGITLTDPTIPTSGTYKGQGPIYIAWANDYLPAQPPPNWNQYAIMMVESSDGGLTWSAPIYVNNSHNSVTDERDAYPKITVSQGTLATNGSGVPNVEPGQVTAVWDDYGSDSTASPPFDLIDSNHTVTTSTAPSLEVGTDVVDPTGSPVAITDATGTSAPYTPSITTIPFSLSVPSNFSLTDMDVELGLTGPDISEFLVQLVAPNGTTFTIIQNGKDATGNATGTPPPGAAGSALGEISTLGTDGIFGTSFNDGAGVPIEAGSSPYPGSYTPDGGSFVGAFGHLTSSQLSGTWMLKITDFVADANATTPQQVVDFKVTLSSIKVSNQSNVTSSFVTGSENGPFNAPGDYPASPSMGIGPAPEIASDNTLGGYSEYQGRIYVAYVDKGSDATSNTNIGLMYSDNGGKNWSNASAKVNDDQATLDGYSGDAGNTNDRSQFEPSVAVDNATGTLVLTWYDARYDASDARVSRYITTSLDGGSTFGSQTYLNEPNQVYDAISGEADDLGPIPDNFSSDAQSLIGEGQFFYGTSQGLAVYDGRVYATWTGNENQGPQGNLRLGILTSTTTYSSGPTIVSSTQGVVSTPEDIVNPAQNLGGSTGTVPAFQYIDVTFDRPIVPSSFVPGDIDIQYRNDSTPGTQAPTSDISSLIGSIVPLNLQYWGNGNAQDKAATEFRIELTSPQTSVGTYSYYISPSVNDGYEYFGYSGTNVTTLTASTQDPTQANIVVPARGSSSASSNIVVPSGGDAGQTIMDVQVNVEFNGANDAAFYELLQELGSEYTLTLSNGAISVSLAADELGASQTASDANLLPDLAGHGYVSTTFDDESTEPIFDGNFQFSGTYHPEGNLAKFAGTKLTAGSTWTLSITSSHQNSGSVPTGLLRDWSIQFTTETLQADDTQPAISGNVMDQNADAIPGQPASFASGFQTTGDVWAMPAPSDADSYTSGSPNYFTSPFAAGTSAIIVPGPSITSYLQYDANVGGGVAIPNNSNTVTSTITIGGDSSIKITDLLVKLQIAYSQDSDLKVVLVSPAGTPITLVAPISPAPGGNDANFGDSTNLGSYKYLGPTVFTDDAINPVAGTGSSAPFIGLYSPVDPLSNLDGESLAGTWTLQITNVGASTTGTLNAWSITADTQTSPTDNSISQIAVHFDRNMTPSTLNASNISVVGPQGAIAGPFTITPDYNYDPNNLDPDSNNARTYLIGFPAQTLSGTYVVTLTPNSSYPIESTDGTPIDTDQNAGVDMLDDTGSTASNTYSTSGTTLPPNYTSDGVYNSTITVPPSDAGLIQKITVSLVLNTNRGPASDLSAVLIAPNGQAVQLFADLSTSTSFSGLTTTFADVSTVPITSGSSGYGGIFTSQQPLSVLLDSNSTGTWTLVIKNAGANSTYTLSSWSMQITTPAPNTGAGATVADSGTTSFQLFNLGSSDDQSHEVWTPVGGAVNTGSNSAAGPVTAIGVDPSDPSGNTVYIGAATGGVWKTTNFLTDDPSGPTYVPLIANAPTNGLNIGSIAVLGSQVNPATGNTVPSMVFAATGNGNTNTLSPGIGILIGTYNSDGTMTWNLATGLTNTDSSGNWVSTSSSSRDNTFDGLIAYKIVVDPHLQANGQAIIYVAFTDPTTNGKGGLYRSVDSGKTWSLMRAGQATDVVLDLNSAIPSFNNSDVNNPTDNVNAIDAAFAGDGIYRSPNRGVTWTELLGTNPDTNILDYSVGNAPPVKVSNLPTPDGDFGRIVLATPSLTGNPTQDALYEGWLYAAVVSQSNLNNPDGTLLGLYLTKDYGQTWTQVQINGKLINGTISQNPTDDTTQGNYDVTNGPGIGQGVGNYAIALSVDPNNPNVVYLGSSAYTNHAAGMIRVDTTGISDAHAFYQGENAPDGGAIRADTTDVVALKNWYNTASPSVGSLLTSITEPTINLLQNPSEPFSLGSAVATNNIADLSNSGANITWIPFDYAFDYSNSTETQNLTAVVTPSEYHQIYTEVDPQTGLSRLIVATDQGIYSAVDDNGVIREYGNTQAEGVVAESAANEQEPSGSPETWDGPYGQVVQTLSLNEPISGSRNGNLQIAELYYGAVQPSQSAADAAGSLFYGEAQGVGLVSSSSNILTTGDTTWKGSSIPSGGGGVATDQTGTGTEYNYANPFLSGTATDFFQVNGGGRTTGLLTTGTDTGVASHDAEWTDFVDSGNLEEGTFTNNQSSNSDFAVNPINGSEIVMSSHPSGDAGAQIFATQNQGVNWSVIGYSNDLDDTYAPALAYGAPSTNVAEGNFIYAGTDGGHIYVTFTGGGSDTSGNPWISISSGLDGSQVEAIVADPNHNTFDAYAVTQKGVYYMADASVANPVWQNITGNLLSLTSAALGNGNLYTTAIQMLTTMTADWRYATPVLYVGANPGVYRGINEGGTWTWTLFPNQATDGAPADGGELPNTEVSDLDLSTGNVDATTGIPLSNNTANNILLASTFGNGAYAIRLGPVVTLNASAASSPGVQGAAGSLTVNGVTTYYVNADEDSITLNGASEKEITENGTTYNEVTINVYDLTNDPNETTPIGTATTDSNGNFTVTINRPSPDGLHDIVLVGT